MEFELTEKRLGTFRNVILGGDSFEVNAELDSVCARISDEYLRRKSRRSGVTEPLINENANAWLKRTCYKLVIVCLQEDAFDILEERVARRGRRSRGVRGNANIFQTGLLAIFAHDKDALGHRERERFGKQLWVAFRHYVPPEFLNGFLSHIGADTDKYAGERGVLISTYDDWIIKHRFEERKNESSDSCADFRGEYLAHIENEVEAHVEALIAVTRRRKKKKKKKK